MVPMRKIDVAHLNTSGIEPLEYKVLVLPEKVEEKTKGGILLPDEIKERDQHAAMQGRVIAISPTAFNFDEKAPRPAVGEAVIFARYSGVTIKGSDGQDYRLMNDKDIAGVRRNG